MTEVYQGGTWDLKLQQHINTLAEEEREALINALEEITVQPTDGRDDIKWRWSATGLYTVKSAYNTMMDRPAPKNTTVQIWKIKAPTRVAIFTWLMLRNRILTIDNLRKREWCLVNRCHMCKREEESVNHLFGECNYAQQVIQHKQCRVGTECQYFIGGNTGRPFSHPQAKGQGSYGW